MNLAPRLLVLLAWNWVLWLIKLMSRGPYGLLGIYGFTFWADWNLNIIHFRHAPAWSHNQVRLANQNQDFSCTGNSHVSLPFFIIWPTYVTVYVTTCDDFCYDCCYDVLRTLMNPYKTFMNISYIIFDGSAGDKLVKSIPDIKIDTGVQIRESFACK